MNLDVQEIYTTSHGVAVALGFGGGALVRLVIRRIKARIQRRRARRRARRAAND